MNGIEFTKNEQIVIYEVARVALADAEIFDHMAVELDLSDEEMKNIQMKLEKFME